MSARSMPSLSAFALGEPVRPLGFRKDGRPIFPIAGGADDDPPADPPADPPKNDPPAYTPPASQADLDRIIGDRLAREREKYADYDELKQIKAERDKAVEEAQTEHEKAVKAAREEGKTEALTTANARLVSAEARALAAEAKFRNPATAVRLLDLSGIKVGDDGAVDTEAVKAKLKTLSDAEPYLLATEDGKGKPKPDRGQGGGGDGKGSSLTGLSGSDLYDRLHPKKQEAS